MSILRSGWTKCSLYLIFYLVAVSVSGNVINAQSLNQLERARELETQNRWGEAKKAYRSFVRTNPTSTEAAEGWLKLAIRTKDWTEGKRALMRLEKIDPELSRSAQLGTRLFYQQDKFDTALIWGQRYRSRNPENWKPYHYLALIQLQRNNFFAAGKMVESAKLRTRDNQWVLLDDFLVKFNTDRRTEAENIMDELLSVATNPTVHWILAKQAGEDFPLERLKDLLESGSEYLPTRSPPLRNGVSTSNYRYWWARFNYLMGDVSAAKNILPSDPSGFRSSWLRARLESPPSSQLEMQKNVLDRWPDNLLAQWQQSILARRVEPIDGDNRRSVSQFYLSEYRNNRYLNYEESALAALVRSLELNPLDEKLQFELARYFDDRGWERSQRFAAERADDLGFNPPTRVSDYLEALGDPDTGPAPNPDQLTMGVRVEVQSHWDGPIEGDSGLTNMVRHTLYHQPAFSLRGPRSDGRSPINQLIDGDTIDGGVRVRINEWEDNLSATLEFYLSDGRLIDRQFYGSGKNREWRLTNQVIETLKQRWPWTGRIYRIESDGAWVNLGRIHGFEEGDTLTIKREQDLFEEPPTIETIHQDRLKIGFPSPYYETEARRGTPVGRQIQEID